MSVLDVSKKLYYRWRLSSIEANIQSGATGKIRSGVSEVEKISQEYPELVKEFSPRLIDLLDAGEKSIQLTACVSLANIAEDFPAEVKRGVANLYRCLNHSEEYVRSNAVRALAEIGQTYPSEFQYHQVKPLMTDDSAAVRQNTIVAIGKVAQSDSSLVNHLSANDLIKLLDDDDYTVREISVRTIGNMAKEGIPTNSFVNEAVVEQLKEILENDFESSRKNCALTLGYLGNDQQLPFLKEQRRKEQSESVERALTRAIELIEEAPNKKDSEMGGITQSHFGSSDSDTRIYHE